ncbi:Na(+)/dicarboxylate symporter [Serratia rubidaea]|uniref:Na(+)/dicarboxylate symporter n=1 Tax=Serratia rubidaea TaxID=61652 RepID=A0A4U9HRU2_SERRU|nr:Na(+)/dicarboxylate symporter [Serratia rubidaea]
MDEADVNSELLWVLCLLLVAIVLFTTNKLRMDVVALLVIIAFVLSGTLTLQEATVGFSDPNVILIAALFVIGEGLVRTGVAYQVGDWLVKVAGSSETKMLVLLMVTVAGLGAFMSSTGVVAIFIPVVLSVAARMKTAPGRLMMPLSFAGLISGMMTLVATPPNMVVNSELVREGIRGFGFFGVTPIGMLVLVLGVGLYAAGAALAGRRLAGQPQRELAAPHLPRSDPRLQTDRPRAPPGAARGSRWWGVRWMSCICGRATAPTWWALSAGSAFGG